VVTWRAYPPFFFEFDEKIKVINNSLEKATDELIARDPVLYKKGMFRAFLNYSKKEVDKMTMQEYLDSTVMLDQVLRLWHAPYINK
jgi:hypothetical protein